MEGFSTFSPNSSESLKQQILKRRRGVEDYARGQNLVTHDPRLGDSAFGSQTASQRSAHFKRRLGMPAAYLPRLSANLVKKIKRATQNPPSSPQPPAVVPPVPNPQPEPPTSVESLLAFRASNRFGLGPRPGDLEEIQAAGPRQWVLNQLEVANPDFLQDIPTVRQTYQRARFTINYRGIRTGAHNNSNAFENIWKTVSKYDQMYSVEQGFLFYRNLCTTAHDVQARLALFWSNHFNIFPKWEVANFADTNTGLYAYITDTLAGHMMGNFSDMVMANAKSPQMLYYLDNLGNRGTIGGGLNENYGREILELHTLGVDNGYTHADVVAFSQILSGWDIVKVGWDRPLTDIWNSASDFWFSADRHNEDHKDPSNPNMRLDTYFPVIDWHTGVYNKSEGLAKGEEAIRRVTKTTYCARFIAKKLLKEFVSESPTQSDIDAIAAVFMQHKDSPTQLKEVYKALFQLPSAWDFSRVSYKFVDHYLISVYRALGLIDRDINPNFADPDYGYRPSDIHLTPDNVPAGTIQPNWQRMYWDDLEILAARSSNFPDLKNWSHKTSAGFAAPQFTAPTDREILNRDLLKDIFMRGRDPSMFPAQGGFLNSLGYEFGYYLTPEGVNRNNQSSLNPGNIIGRILVLDKIMPRIMAYMQNVPLHLRGVFPQESSTLQFITQSATSMDDITMLLVAFMSDEFLRK